MDIISNIFHGYCEWIARWSPQTYYFFPHAVLLFGLPCCFCGFAFSRGSRSMFVQVLLGALGVLLAASIPIERMALQDSFAKAALFSICAVFLPFLPSFLPMFLVPRAGAQKKLQASCYAILCILLIANLLQRGNPP